VPNVIDLLISRRSSLILVRAVTTRKAMNWVIKYLPRNLRQEASEENLSFDGHGSVYVPLANIVNSPKVREQIAAVKQIAEIEGQEENKK
jgi:hypothetical protein